MVKIKIECFKDIKKDIILEDCFRDLSNKINDDVYYVYKIDGSKKDKYIYIEENEEAENITSFNCYNDIKDYIVRIYFSTSNNGFYIIKIKRRGDEELLDSPQNKEACYGRKLKLGFDFNIDCFKPFYYYSLAHLVNSLEYNDDIQLQAYYFYFSMFTLESICFMDKKDMVLCYRKHKHYFKKDKIDNKPKPICGTEPSYLLCMGLYVVEYDGWNKHRKILLSYELAEECYENMVTDGLIDPSVMSFESFITHVFIHELGHNAYDNSGFKYNPFDIALNERLANYFASLMLNGKFDKEMQYLTIL